MREARQRVGQRLTSSCSQHILYAPRVIEPTWACERCRSRVASHDTDVAAHISRKSIATILLLLGQLLELTREKSIEAPR